MMHAGPGVLLFELCSCWAAEQLLSKRTVRAVERFAAHSCHRLQAVVVSYKFGEALSDQMFKPFLHDCGAHCAPAHDDWFLNRCCLVAAVA